MTERLPPRSTANPSPVLRAGAIRRTTSIDVTWGQDPAGPRRFDGRARDLLRGDGGDRVVAEARMDATLDFDRTITAMAADPAPARLSELVGQRGGGHLRGVLREIMPQLVAQAHPLYLLLDDISGTSLVCNWAWSQWSADWAEGMRRAAGTSNMAQLLEDRRDVCWGFQAGSAALDPSRNFSSEKAADGKELRNPADPAGWHDFPVNDGLAFRRARRIDLWREGGKVRIECAFQDSATRPEGGRAALHEYVIRASLDGEDLILAELEPEGRVLPFGECPGAIANARSLIGTPIGAMREAVLDRLRGPAGCTHLNDALRAMAEVPQLLENL